MNEETGRANILLVEDTVSLAKTYIAFLKDLPYDVTHVETGREANAFLADTTPDAVLLDLVLPDGSGLEILKSISERGLPTSVVVITAHGSVNTAVEAMRLGAFDFIVKPFNAERLTVTLKNALGNIQQQLGTHVSSKSCGTIERQQNVVGKLTDERAPGRQCLVTSKRAGYGEPVHRRSRISRVRIGGINGVATYRKLRGIREPLQRDVQGYLVQYLFLSLIRTAIYLGKFEYVLECHARRTVPQFRCGFVIKRLNIFPAHARKIQHQCQAVRWNPLPILLINVRYLQALDSELFATKRVNEYHERIDFGALRPRWCRWLLLLVGSQLDGVHRWHTSRVLRWCTV